MMNGLIDRGQTTFLSRAVETKDALLFCAAGEMEKAFRSCYTNTTPYYKLRAIPYSQCELDCSFESWS